MKRTFGQFLRTARLPMLGICAAGTLMAVGCSKSDSDPDAVTVDQLKYPGNLQIWDKGNGKVVLTWTGTNNEKDFDGYNVYGMKTTVAPDANGTYSDLGVTEGDALKLLDDAGEADAAARAILAKFNYDPAAGKKLEVAGAALADDASAAADDTSSDDKPEFSALPIHTGSGDSRLVPTCKAMGGTCVPTTAANKDATASDAAYAANGTIKFDLAAFDSNVLTVGSTYCFLVLSSMDGGKKVSSTSSNVECVDSMYSTAFKMTLPNQTNGSNNQAIGLTAWLADCVSKGTCADPTTSFFKVAAGSHNGSSTDPVYIEETSDSLGLVAGKHSGIADLGYYAAGFDDTTLPAKAPTFVLDTDLLADGVTPIFNNGGYSSAGQTVPLVQNHVYVIAVGDAAATTAPTTFHYYWLYVKGDLTGASTDVEVRMAKADK